MMTMGETVYFIKHTTLMNFMHMCCIMYYIGYLRLGTYTSSLNEKVRHVTD